MQYKQCPDCGANLDSGERCDCSKTELSPIAENMKLYNAVKTVPPDALKKITGGRLSGMSSINPMWRIKALTEQFGPCGVGWKYSIDKQWTETGANDEIKAFVNISLYIKNDGEWSEPIPGTGGNSFVAKEKNGPYTSDECYKMALTDALSTACKALGMAGDTYWKENEDKYSRSKEDLSFHSVYAVKTRIEQLITAKIQSGIDYSDLLATLGLKEKQMDNFMKYFDTIYNLEARLRAL